jgi:hypothetical protein
VRCLSLLQHRNSNIERDAHPYGLQQDPRYVTSTTSPPLARGTESQINERAFSGAHRSSGASCNSPTSPQATSRDHPSGDAGYSSSALDRSRAYPAGTWRVVSKDGQTYCLDEDNRILDQWPMRREPEPAPRPLSLDTLTHNFEHLGIASSNHTNPALSPANKSQRSNPPGNRLSPTRIKGGTVHRDDKLDRRK